MLTIASQSFAHGTWTITPEEPSTLLLALAGVATLAVYAVLTGWRPQRTSVTESTAAIEELGQTLEAHTTTTTRRAA